ncbi:MAG: hypothetical protein RBU23_07370 [Candidatus Auribacterota bacterium]|jgi:outer membrane lipoprotein-sorting protein|nr:hypothetical protein [Candidatus Auribacterota bacterium]
MKYYLCFILLGILITSAYAEIDPSAVGEIRSLTQYILELNNYKYTLTSVTFKNRKQHRNVMLYYYDRPDKIRIEWLEPRKLRGQLAVYNQGVMKAAPSWLPFVIEVNPDSSLGMADFNYPIYNSTLGHLMSKVVDELDLAHTVRVIEKTDSSIVYEVINDQNRAKIKVNTAINIPVYIEQYDLKGQLVDGGYFDDVKANISYSDGFFDL